MLKENLEAPVKLMKSALDRVNFKNEIQYAEFLAQSHYYVAHSTRLLAYAAGHMSKHEERFFRRFIKHISEEMSHEVLAERDLNDLGFQLKDFVHRPETKMLWEPQYYKIQFLDPMCFMGYILALEMIGCIAMPEVLEQVQPVYKGKAVRFVQLHADEDPDHVDQAIHFSEQLSEERQFNILENAIQTAVSYANMVDSFSKKPILSSLSKDFAL